MPASARQSQNVPVSYPRSVEISPTQATRHAHLQGFCASLGRTRTVDPSLPWRFSGVTQDHARSFATQFFLQIGSSEASRVRRPASRMSFLMCPFCVRVVSLDETTPCRNGARVGSVPATPRCGGGWAATRARLCAGRPGRRHGGVVPAPPVERTLRLLCRPLRQRGPCGRASRGATGRAQ